MNEWIKQIDDLLNTKFKDPDEHMASAQQTSKEIIDDHNDRLKEKKERDLLIDFTAQKVDNYLLTNRDAEKNNDEEAEEKSF